MADRSVSRRSLFAAGLTGVFAGGAGCDASTGQPAVVPAALPTALILDGICELPRDPGQTVPVPPGSGARFVPGTSVLIGGGTAYAVGQPQVAAASIAPQTSQAAVDALPAIAAARAWIEAGTIPGRSALHRDMATRALLDLRLALRGNGALLAGPTAIWAYVWPRDACWASVALSVTGHQAQALKILQFLAGVQRRDGTWAARTLPDGSGRVPDNRPAQLDAVGWFCWAAWMWRRAAAGQDGRDAAFAALWPAVGAAANAAAASLTSDRLPAASHDYWEHEGAVTIGNTAAVWCGLRAAADLAGQVGSAGQALNWSTAGKLVGAAIAPTFGATGFRRTPSATAAVDSAVTWLGPPLAPADATVDVAVRRAATVLRRPVGGVTPGLPRPGDTTESWTPETGFFALYDASTGAPSADIWLDWLATHRTALGSLPERVNPAGKPIAIAPLAWTNAIVLLALSAQETPLPIP